MKNLRLLAAALIAAGCARDSEPGEAPELPVPLAAEGLTNRIWMRADEAAAPGSMLIFLDSGMLVLDSCWEGYRLAEWGSAEHSRITWTEDGTAIGADIVALDRDRLTLRLNLAGSAEEQRFEPAEASFVCPDMPRRPARGRGRCRLSRNEWRCEHG